MTAPLTAPSSLKKLVQKWREESKQPSHGEDNDSLILNNCADELAAALTERLDIDSLVSYLMSDVRDNCREADQAFGKDRIPERNVREAMRETLSQKLRLSSALSLMEQQEPGLNTKMLAILQRLEDWGVREDKMFTETREKTLFKLISDAQTILHEAKS